jgi:hypothetical protein
MKIQQILSSVNEGVLDDVRARMAAGRDPAAAPPTAAPVANAGRFKVGDTVDFGVGVPRPKVIQQGTVTAVQGTGYTVKTADGQTHELDSRMKSLYLVPAASGTQDVAEAYDPAQASKYIAAATKAAKIIFLYKMTWDQKFKQELELQHGFTDPTGKYTNYSDHEAKQLVSWLASKGCELSYDPNEPIDFSLSMPDQSEPYEFNILDMIQNGEVNESSALPPAQASAQISKFDPVTGLPASEQISEFGGDATQFSTPTQSAPTTEQPPRRGYSIILTGKPGRDWMAEYAWQALETVLPRDYPGQSTTQTNNPAQHKVAEVAKQGSAVVKSGINSEDIAETLVSKLVANRVPAQFWRITSEDLNEGVSTELQSLLKSAGIVQNK